MGPVLAVQARGPQFGLSAPSHKVGLAECIYNPNIGKAETDGSPKLSGHHAPVSGKRRDCLKQKVESDSGDT